MVNEKLKTSFGKLSKIYDKVRPDYPEKLIDDIIKISNISNDANILEIGTGTGKATLPFTKKGYKITTIDISKEQINIAKSNLSKYSNVKYIVSAFEESNLPKEHYDLVFSAQTFPWIEPNVGFKKVSRILKNNGYFAIFYNQRMKNNVFEQNLRKLYLKHCPDLNKGEEDKTLFKMKKGLKSTGKFDEIKIKNYKRVIKYTREKYIGLINSLSYVSTLPKEKKLSFFKDLNKILGDKKTLFVPTKSTLIIAKKK
ncbi:MAG: class I SAM-dependent methyltransferase [Candidatus Woesearchaeota archaeon]